MSLKLNILTFHRVLGEDEDYFLPPMAIQSQVFSRMVANLGRMKTIIDMDDFLSNRYKKKFSENCVAITFDDAYIDNFEIAKPILERIGAPATFFVPVYPVENGGVYWWDHIYNVAGKDKKGFIKWLKKKKSFNQISKKFCFHGNDKTSQLCRDIVRYLNKLSEIDRQAFLSSFGEEFGSYDGERLLMNWDEVRQLKKSGFSIGSHSLSHVPLTDLPNDKAQREIKESKFRLEQKLGKTVSGFSYPRGSYSKIHARIVERAGYSYAVTTRFGSNQSGCDIFELARRNISDFQGFRSYFPVSMQLLELTGIFDSILSKRRT